MCKLEELYFSVPDWANIPDDIVRCIAEHVNSFQDRARLSSVCRSWHASLRDEKMMRLPICLMLAEKENSDSDSDSNRRGFYSISEEMFGELELPEVRGSRCWGSPFGWLVVLPLDLQIHLLNPLSRATIPLPSLLTFPHQQQRPAEELRNYFIYKILLTSDPSSPDCIVVAIYSEFSFLGFAKPGDKAWTPIYTSKRITSFSDATCFNGSLFATHWDGTVYTFEDLHDGNGTPKLVEFVAAPPTYVGNNKYLVDIDGNFCMVSRSIGGFEIKNDKGEKVERRYLTEGFEIFKLDMQTREWAKILSLDNRSLFLGNCTSFSLVAADYVGCMPNCIYFTDDDYLNYETVEFSNSESEEQNDDDELNYYREYVGTRGSDMGIFECDNVVIDRNDPLDSFPRLKGVQDLHSSFSPPLWIVPSST